MYGIKYKTRGMINPQGLPKVYFSCHPEDFERYFEVISDEILKKQNCAVFYYDNLIPYDEEEMFLDLGQMHLFVMPITTNLLTKNNRAIDVEFGFAMENHIPVLPIMQEKGLEELFKMKCGDFQFLNRNEMEKTAISYDEKLEKYLLSVLIGDELAAKVKAAFDAYIFLSYRKKDRKYAQELMRLIHKNDFCRDIAIWYDEFLVPGENFNNSIEDALKKSDLFALVVTPNLINETNYVMTTEYPMAMQENKLVLPAEIIETDKKLLKEMYKGIPNCTDVHDDAALTESLLNAVKAMAINENDSSPEHLFFIGIAYLSGIDVEKNHERAVNLITSAAESGLPEAMEKLVSMYCNGEGVAINYETAVKWQKKYVEFLEEKKHDSKEDVERYLNETTSLVYFYHEQELFDEVKSTCNSIISFIATVNGRYNELFLKRFLIDFYFYLAVAEKDTGNYINAINAYQTAAEHTEALPRTDSNISSLTLFYGEIGRMFYELNDFSESKKYMEKSIDIMKQRSELNMFFKIESVQNILERMFGSNHEKNTKWLDELIETLIKQIEVTQMSFYKVELSQLLLAKAECAITFENSEIDVFECITKALEYASQAFEEHGTRHAHANFYRISERAMGLYFSFAKQRKNCPVLELSLPELFSGSLEDNFSFADGHSYSEAIPYSKFINIAGSDLSSNSVFENMFGKCKEQVNPDSETEAINEATSSVENKSDLSISYGKLGNKAYLEDRFSEAKEYYLKAAEIREQLVKEAETPENISNLLTVYANIGCVAKSEGNIDEAEAYFLKALEIPKLLLKERYTFGIKECLSGVYFKLGDIAKSKGDFRKAKQYHLKSFEIRAQLAEEADTIEVKRDLFLSCNRLGNIFKSEEEFSKAEKYYLRCITLSEEIAEEIGTHKAYDDLAFSYYRMGILHEDNPDMCLIEKAYKIYEDLCKKCPSDASYSELRAVMKSILEQKK